MSWSIALIDNTVVLDKSLEEKLLTAQDYDGQCWYEGAKIIDEDGQLIFNPDAYEHMDYLRNNKKVLQIIAESGATGDITFGSMEGDNAGSFWGYRFRDGKVVRLTGDVFFEEIEE